MNVVDSSAWIEYYTGGSNASYFLGPILDRSSLLVPAISLYEVYKWVAVHRNESDALTAVSGMQQGTVIAVDSVIALDAARASIELLLPLADSIIFATARAHNATLWTQDTDFKDLPGVRFRQRNA